MELGQVVWMRCKLNNNMAVGKGKRPFIILEINNNENYIEFAPLSSIENKPHKVLFKSNHLIKYHNPQETVITKHSIVQMDNPIQVEVCDEVKNYIENKDKLSESKLKGLLEATEIYRESNELDEMRCVYVTSEEFVKWNRNK